MFRSLIAASAAARAGWRHAVPFVLSFAAALLSCASCELLPEHADAEGPSHPAESPSRSRSLLAVNAGEFTIVVLPDTQYYAARNPQIFDGQTRWIVQERAVARVALVLHEGDIVDDDQPVQWERASHSLHLLDDVVPYLVSAGNHDYRRLGNFIGRTSSINAYFPVAGFARNPWFKGTFEPEHIENSYAIIDAPGGPWLALSLEFAPRDAALRWADEVLTEHAALPAIVVTHAYLSSDGQRFDAHAGLPQPWNPHRYVDEIVVGGANDGAEIWQKVISRHDNVLFVLCGHDLGSGVSRLTSLRPDGAPVHQLLANYQMAALGGDGYLRLMQFSPARRRVSVKTTRRISIASRTTSPTASSSTTDRHPAHPSRVRSPVTSSQRAW